MQVDDAQYENSEFLEEVEYDIEECEAEAVHDHSGHSEAAAVRKKSVTVAEWKVLEHMEEIREMDEVDESEEMEEIMESKESEENKGDINGVRESKKVDRMEGKEGIEKEDVEVDEVKLKISPYFEYKELVTMIEDHVIVPFDVKLRPLPYKETSV